MTSFAGNKSCNFCGRLGVNSSTALRTVVGSKEDIGGKGENGSETDRETCWPQYGNQHASARTIPCQPRVTANSRPRRVRGHGRCETADCLRTVCVRDQCLYTDCRNCDAFAVVDMPGFWPWNRDFSRTFRVSSATHSRTQKPCQIKG